MRAGKDALGLYILVARTAVPESDTITWATWLNESYVNGQHWVAKDHIGPIFVSTIFLGIDHNFGFSGPPLVFETGVLIEPEDGRGLTMLAERRYSTWAEAERGHRVALRYARMRLKSVETTLTREG